MMPEQPFTFTVSDGDASVTGRVNTCPKDLVIPSQLNNNPVKKVCALSFAGKLLISLLLQKSMVEIGDDAFHSNSLGSVLIPDLVTDIGDHAFDTNQISLLSIGNHVQGIGVGAFHANWLNVLTIPASVIVIGSNAFAENSLTSVVFGGDAPVEAVDVFSDNPKLVHVDRYFSALGWGATWSGVPVVTLPDLQRSIRMPLALFLVAVVILVAVVAIAGVDGHLPGVK